MCIRDSYVSYYTRFNKTFGIQNPRNSWSSAAVDYAQTRKHHLQMTGEYGVRYISTSAVEADTNYEQGVDKTKRKEKQRGYAQQAI